MSRTNSAHYSATNDKTPVENPGRAYFPNHKITNWLLADKTLQPETSDTHNQDSSKPPTMSEPVEIQLENSFIWNTFHQHETEMTVTKQGRRMFPTLRYKINGLDPNSTYSIEVRFVPCDDYRRKYQTCRWTLFGKYDTNIRMIDQGSNDKTTAMSGSIYHHPDSPASGKMWMKQPVSLHKIKLTNNAKSVDSGAVLLTSMRKYIPVLFVYRLHVSPCDSSTFDNKSLVACKTFDETAFIAVTSYQNPKITDLKVKNNPFAKGFRHLRKGPIKQINHSTGESEDKKRKSNKHDHHSGSDKRISVKSNDPELDGGALKKVRLMEKLESVTPPSFCQQLNIDSKSTSAFLPSDIEMALVQSANDFFPSGNLLPRFDIPSQLTSSNVSSGLVPNPLIAPISPFIGYPPFSFPGFFTLSPFGPRLPFLPHLVPPHFGNTSSMPYMDLNQCFSGSFSHPLITSSNFSSFIH